MPLPALLPLLKFLPSAMGALGALQDDDKSDMEKLSAAGGAASGISDALGASSQDGALDSLMSAWRGQRGGGDVSDEDLLNATRRR